jgi:hypothetical protein
MNRFSRFLPIVVASAGLLVALSGCGGGYGGDGGASGSNQITSISITPVEATITSDDTQQFTAVATNSAGNTVPGFQLDWRSSNTGVATINADGLATAVAAGTTTITARRDTSTDYAGGGFVISNEAALTVSSSAGVTGLAAAAAPMGNALIILRDQAGNSQTILTDAAGRFSASVAGMLPPFVLRVSDQQGHSLYSAGVQPGVVNINPLTDLLVRAWYRAHGMNADVAFTGRQAPGGPDAKALESLSGALESAFRATLSGQGLALNQFSFFTTPYAADGTGLDRILAQLRTSVGTSRMAIHDELSGRNAEVIFTSHERAELRIRSAMGRVTAVPLLPDDH